jgi:hypothetical protein
MTARSDLLQALKLLDDAEEKMRPGDGLPPPIEFIGPWGKARHAMTDLILATPVDPDAPTVHYCGWSSQPEIGILCTGAFTCPAWGQPDDEDDVYRTEEGDLYTFDAPLVTCQKCRERLMEADFLGE